MIDVDLAPAFLPPPLAPAPTPWDLRASIYAEPIVSDDAPGISFRFSVDPWALGAPGTAVSAESLGADAGAGMGPWTSPGEAAGDVFGTPVLTRVGGVTVAGGVNLLVDDQATLGLMPTDDLDALILWVRPDVRLLITNTINQILAMRPWMPAGNGALIGPGMTISITQYLGAALPPGSICVGFSVTTDSVGLEYTAVDFEAGPVFPPIGAISAAAGDIFYASVDSAPVGTNFVSYEEVDLGLDPGARVNGALLPAAPPAIAGLAVLSDNLDALDSTNFPPGMFPFGGPSAGLSFNDPFISVGEMLDVNATVTGGAAAARVDARFSIRLPRGATIPVVTRSNVLVPAGQSRTVRVFRHTFHGNEPRGRYEAILRLTDHATQSVITEVRRPFDFP
ncbi:MAG: hypothetical protein HYR85_22435 [Planctomycetes bacterium]|nr:hypothetical protein [Planctomycetota bacterium]